VGHSIPDPPSGYQEPNEYEEATTIKKTFLTVPGVASLGLTAILFLGAVSLVPISLDLVADIVLSIAGNSTFFIFMLVFGGFGIIALGTVILHEHVHRIVMEHFGYSVKIHYGLPQSYALIEEQMVQRNHNLVSLLSPFVVISSLSLAASYLISNSLLTVMFSGVFIINTTSASGDLRGWISLIRRPAGTKIWHTHENEVPRSFVYEPE